MKGRHKTKIDRWAKNAPNLFSAAAAPRTPLGSLRCSRDGLVGWGRGTRSPDGWGRGYPLPFLTPLDDGGVSFEPPSIDACHASE